jgi:tetratricopeptide (TPR) repeat protein
MMPRTSFVLSGLFAASLLAACQSTETVPRSEDAVANLILHGQYVEAVELAKKEYDANPNKPRTEERYRQASIAFLMEQGRRATFEDEDDAALVFFEQARELDPQEPMIRAWIDKTHEKLSERWLERALQLHAKGQLKAAVEAYEIALQHTPGHAGAVRGMSEATLQINYRAGLALDYYNQGVRTFHDYWLERSRRSFAVVNKYVDEPPSRVNKRRGQVETYLADERAAVALSLEERGLYDAARNEYRLCLALDPDHKNAKAGFERMDRESEAATLLRDARMQVLRGEFDQARELVAKGIEVSDLQDEQFKGVLVDIDSARVERMYQAALDLEKDYKYFRAIAMYKALIDEFEYYKDALARKGTLEDYIEKAPRYYAEAEAEPDLEIKLRLFKASRDMWPEYKDVEDRIVDLERQLAEQNQE